MAKVLVTEHYLTDIASAIRSKTGSGDSYRPGEMAAAIQGIEAGYPEPEGTIDISQNGTVNVKDYASAAVDVQPTLQEKSVTANGTIVPDAGYDGLSRVVVNVSGGGGVDGILFGTDAPEASVGVAGDYYYQYKTSHDSMFENGVNMKDGSQTSAYGNEFTVNREIVVTALRGRTKNSKSGSMRIGTTSEILATVTGYSFRSNEWVSKDLPTPITLVPGVNYIVQVLVSGSGAGSIGYTDAETKTIGSVTHIGSRYGTDYPGGAEEAVYVNADIVFDDGIRTITHQYYRESDRWWEL